MCHFLRTQEAILKGESAKEGFKAFNYAPFSNEEIVNVEAKNGELHIFNEFRAIEERPTYELPVDAHFVAGSVCPLFAPASKL